MTPQAKQVIDAIKGQYGDPRKVFSEDVIADLIAARCFYVMRAQDDSIAFDRVKAVTNATYEDVMKHYFPDWDA